MTTRSNTDHPVTKIYESPDGGKTIYVRDFGSELKTLVPNDDSIKRQLMAGRANRLLAILKISETDTTLNDALQALEALYILKYGDDKNN